MLSNYYGAEAVNYEKTLAEAMSYAERLKPMVVDVSSALYAAEQAGQNLLFEGAQEKTNDSFDTVVNRYNVPFYQGFNGTCTSYRNDQYGNVPCNAPADMHGEQSVFSFVDGHSKSMKPWTTYSQDTANYVIANTPKPGLTRTAVSFWNKDAHLGAGQKDLWNPQVSSIQYP